MNSNNHIKEFKPTRIFLSMRNIVLLVDKDSKAWDFAKKIKYYIETNKQEYVKIVNVPIGLFRNGELRFDSPSNLRKKDVYYIQDSSKEPQKWWVELLLIRDLVLSSSANSLTFILPNLLYSRQDRKDKSRVPISARALANSISSGVKKIITMDLHARQIQGFYPPTTPLDNLHSFSETVKYLIKNHFDYLDNLLILSPDAGGVTRAKSFLTRIEKHTQKKCEIAFVIKERSAPGEVGKTRYVGPDPAGKNVLIVDDIIDSGGTLCSTSKLLKEKGVNKIICYATHGLFTKGISELKENFDLILTSNTHYRENNDIKIIDMSPVFAEAIFRAQKGFSISELFE
jgi:ribose-phosphate pyrophosphokinase